MRVLTRPPPHRREIRNNGNGGSGASSAVIVAAPLSRRMRGERRSVLFGSRLLKAIHPYPTIMASGRRGWRDDAALEAIGAVDRVAVKLNRRHQAVATCFFLNVVLATKVFRPGAYIRQPEILGVGGALLENNMACRGEIALPRHVWPAWQAVQ